MPEKDLFAATGVKLDPQEIDALRKDAQRYRFLRDVDVDTIERGGVFVGVTPANLIVTGVDLDKHVDAAMYGVAMRG